MQKSFTLWRLPPVLIIQLKRFQFDRTNRRKLNNHIDFPIENLDVFDYLATSRQRSLSGEATVDMSGGTGTTTSGGTSGCTSGGASASGATVSSVGACATTATAINTIADAGAGSTTPTEALQGSSSSTALAMSALYGDNLPTPTAIESTTDTSSKGNTQPADPHPTTTATTGAALCTKYDLYSVIHHAGAMGGGHYATTARSLNIHTGPHTPPVTATGADTDTWYCYNDNIVNKVVDTRDISSSSAYVLFYMRQDMRQGDVLSLLRSQLSVPTGIDTVEDMKDEVQYNNNSSSIGTINTTIPVLLSQKEVGNMHFTSTVEVPIVPNDMKHSTVVPGGQVGDGSEQSRGFSVHRKEQSQSCTGQNNSVNDSSTSSNNKVNNSNTTGTSNNKVSNSNSRNNHTTTSSSSDNNSGTSNSSTTATTTVTAAAESGCVPS